LNGILNSKFKAFGSLKPINSEAYNALVKLKQDSYFSLGNVVQVNKNLLTNAGIKLNEVKAISPTAATASMSSLINAPRIVTRTPTTITNAVKNINSFSKDFSNIASTTFGFTKAVSSKASKPASALTQQINIQKVMPENKQVIKQPQLSLLQTTTKSKSSSKPKYLSAEKEISIIDNSLQAKPLEKIKSKSFLDIFSKTRSESITRARDLQKQQQLQKTALKQKSKDIFSNQFNNISLSNPITSLNNTKIDRFDFGLGFGSSDNNKKKSAEEYWGFIPEVRRKGKFIPVGKEPLSRSEAIKKGKEVVSSTLAASFRLTPVKTKKKIQEKDEYEDIGNNFYTKETTSGKV